MGSEMVVAHLEEVGWELEMVVTQWEMAEVDGEMVAMLQGMAMVGKMMVVMDRGMADEQRNQQRGYESWVGWAVATGDQWKVVMMTRG
jgi:hypothetical protein